MVEQLHLKGPYQCRVQTLRDRPLMIDNYRYTDSYEGMYFEGQSIVVEAASDNDGRKFSHWLVNGQQISSARLQHIVNKETIIQAVYTTD